MPISSRLSRSDRKARRIRRRHPAVADAPAYIRCKISCYELLSEQGLQDIEQAADHILAEVGIEFRGDPTAVQLFLEAGAEADGERLTFEPGLLRSLLETAPPEFTQHARNPARSVQFRSAETMW